MKQDEFIRLLETCLDGYNLGETEKKAAVSAAREHGGSKVLESWRRYLKEGGSSFMEFVRELPDRLSGQVELFNLQGEKASGRDPKSPFGQVWDALKKPRSPEAAKDISQREAHEEDFSSWAYDEKAGWTIGGFPVF